MRIDSRGLSKETVRAAVALTLCLSFMVPSVAWSADVSPEEHKLLDELLAANREREKLFGNMHAVWAKVELKDGTKFESTIEFWSRENKYFRFDETFAHHDFRVERHFVTPSRYVRFLSYHPGIRGAVTDYGSVEKGWLEVKSEGWFCEANKRARQTFDYLVDYWLNAENVTLKIRKDEAGGLVITAVTEGEGDVERQHLTYENSEVLEFSPGDYRFLGSKFRLDISDGTWTEDLSIKAYCDPPTEVPISSTFEDIESDGTNYVLRYTLREMQFEPAPSEVFELPEFVVSSSTKWSRRLVFLLVGAAMLAVYVFLKFRKQHDR